MKGDPGLLDHLRELFGASVSIESKQGVGGGCINQTSVLRLSTGESVFLKENSSRYTGLFAAEAAGLRALRSEEGPRVPEPYAEWVERDRQFLLLEFIESGRKVEDFWEDFGRRLARLHARKTANRFGFERDNHIGASPQHNAWEESWPRFFATQRLGFQLELARKNGYARAHWFASLEGLIERIADLLPEPEHPSLLHGDLWGGNFMVGSDGHAVLIDPAVYYGDREADIAMTELFGGFASRFYDAYNTERPLSPGYAGRRELLNLYHLLNHLNLFGGSYAASVESIVFRYS